MKKIIYLIFLLTCLKSISQVTYSVKNGDTLFGIAKNYNVSITSLKNANKSVLKNGLIVGNLLYIPKKESVVVLDSIQSKVIAIELSNCEYTKKELSLVSKILQKTEDNSSIKNKFIDVMIDERNVTNKIIDSSEKLVLNCEEQNKQLQSVIKKQKVKNVFNKITYFLIGVGGTYLILK